MKKNQPYNSLDWQVQPPYLHPAYASTVKRSPQKRLVVVSQKMSELTGPVYGEDDLRPLAPKKCRS